MERNFDTMDRFLLSSFAGGGLQRDDAFAPEHSFVEADEREADLAMLHVLDAVMSKQAAMVLLPSPIQEVLRGID